MTPDNALSHLTAAYAEFCRVNDLENCSADEHDPATLTPYQRRWIDAFIVLWDIQSGQM